MKPHPFPYDPPACFSCGEAGKATMAAIMPMRGADSRYQDLEAARAAAEQEDSARKVGA